MCPKSTFICLQLSESCSRACYWVTCYVAKGLTWIHKVITLLIWLLLFLLGIDVGGNEAIVKGLHAIGLEALIITAAAVTGSTLAAWGLWYLLHTRYQKKEAKP